MGEAARRRVVGRRINLNPAQQNGRAVVSTLTHA